MPIAAVPNYLGTDFSEASPGMRFGMYLKLWEGQAWSKIKDKPLDSAKRLTNNDQKTMHALLARQKLAFDTAPDAVALRLEALATAPFTTGLGNEHPLENGFAFLNPYGLPYLPGSGVKGVLRQSARELLSGEWGDHKGWNSITKYALDIGKGRTIELDLLDVLFGKESKSGDGDHVRGVLSCWDVIPQIRGDSLAVEIMTPHQSHYYQWKKDQRANFIEVSPHDSGQPTPISFLTVPPGSGFTFHIVCDHIRLKHIAPVLMQNAHWKTLLAIAFEHAFQWLGFGAKTAVGYGAMQRDTKAEARAAEEKSMREAEVEKQAAFVAATTNLPEDAAYIVKQKQSGAWNDNGVFLADAEKLKNESEKLSADAIHLLTEEMENKWKGIMDNPDATQGKKQEPKFKSRPRELAKWLRDFLQ